MLVEENQRRGRLDRCKKGRPRPHGDPRRSPGQRHPGSPPVAVGRAAIQSHYGLTEARLKPLSPRAGCLDLWNEKEEATAFRFSSQNVQQALLAVPASQEPGRLA
jgi:hypothetical protein